MAENKEYRGQKEQADMTQTLTVQHSLRGGKRGRREEMGEIEWQGTKEEIGQ